MNPFLKIVDLEGDMLYINPRWIVSIRRGVALCTGQTKKKKAARD